MSGVLARDQPDRVATTLALLRVNHERESSYLGGYLPFAYHCLRQIGVEDEPIGTKALQEAMEAEFGLRLPLGVMKALLREGEAAGKIREDRKVYFPVVEKLADCDLDPARVQFGKRINELASGVARYAQEKHAVAWDRSDAKALLIEYADGFSSDILAAALGRQRLPQRAPHEVGEDLFVIHEFALEASENRPDDFDLLVGLVKARMLADSLYLDIAQQQERPLKGVEVYFDGPVLLYILGNAGPEIQAPYLELIEMLKEQGAELRCFHHSVVEAQGILDVAVNRKSAAIRGEQYHGDVVGWLVRSDRTRTDIELQANNLAKNLEALGIGEEEMPDRIPDLQPDEEALEQLILKFIPTMNKGPLVRDVDSLVGVHTMRRGRVPRTLDSCRAVLVTHNYALFKASASFFRERHGGKTVPHCVYDASFATVIWLHGPKQFPDVPREFVLADANAALEPSTSLWVRCDEAAQELFERGEIDEDELRFLRYADDARVLLMDLTRGDPDSFTDGTLSEMLGLYRERVVRDEHEKVIAVERHLKGEREAHADTQRLVEKGKERLSDTRARVEELSGRVALWMSRGLFVVMGVLLALGVVLGPVGPINADLPLAVQIVSGVIAVSAAVWAGLFGGSLSDLIGGLRMWLASRIEHLVVRLLRL
jgi:hypothetical protein